MVTDIHFAIQPRVDTLLLLGKIPLDKDFWEESYISAFSLEHLIEIIHLWHIVGTCFTRLRNGYFN